MGLTELPSELFHIKNLKIYLNNNNLCSLPSEIAHLAMLEWLYVRLSRLINLDLTHGRAFRSVTTSSRPCQKKAASCDSSSGSPCESRIEWIMI